METRSRRRVPMVSGAAAVGRSASSGNAERLGMVAGTLLAFLVLVGLGLSVTLAEGAGLKALVFVWLWAVPVIGLFALAGWAAGRAVALIRDGASNGRA